MKFHLVPKADYDFGDNALLDGLVADGIADVVDIKVFVDGAGHKFWLVNDKYTDDPMLFDDYHDVNVHLFGGA